MNLRGLFPKNLQFDPPLPIPQLGTRKAFYREFVGNRNEKNTDTYE